MTAAVMAKAAEEYPAENQEKDIQPPYRYLYPSNYFNFPRTIVFNLGHSYKLGRYRYDLKKINHWIPVRIFRKAVKLLFNQNLPLIGYSD